MSETTTKTEVENSTQQSQDKIKSILPERIFPWPVFQKVISYAAVLIIGFSISFLLTFPKDSTDQSEMYKIMGTMGNKEVISTISQQINLESIKGIVNLKETNANMWIEFDLKSSLRFDTKIIYNKADITFLMFRPQSPETLSLMHADNTLIVSSDHPFILYFKKEKQANTPFNISFILDDSVIQSFQLLTTNPSE